jgi:hypothetical protein
LLDLRCNRRRRIIRKSVVLASSEGEFGLQKQFVSANYSRSYRGRDGFADGRFVVMSPLIGGVDPAETLLER